MFELGVGVGVGVGVDVDIGLISKGLGLFSWELLSVQPFF